MAKTFTCCSKQTECTIHLGISGILENTGHTRDHWGISGETGIAVITIVKNTWMESAAKGLHTWYNM